MGVMVELSSRFSSKRCCRARPTCSMSARADSNDTPGLIRAATKNECESRSVSWRVSRERHPHADTLPWKRETGRHYADHFVHFAIEPKRLADRLGSPPRCVRHTLSLITASFWPARVFLGREHAPEGRRHAEHRKEA